MDDKLMKKIKGFGEARGIEAPDDFMMEEWPLAEAEEWSEEYWEAKIMELETLPWYDPKVVLKILVDKITTL